MAAQPTRPRSPPPIRKLDQSVINRIAAGEIIHRPANALKELIENSLDAGATSIAITVKDGGMKMLQIQDNGHGIKKENLEIVCHRFTTSKIQHYDDLSSIQTYGFRGEALASISHVSHLTITTKTADSPCAYRASYMDGNLAPPRPGASADPKPCAGNTGTQILVEDLFYNLASRKKALKNITEEYNRVLEVATKYAIHNAGVAFSCRKVPTTTSDLNTPKNASTLDCIRMIYGTKVASAVKKFQVNSPQLKFECTGLASDSSHSMRKSVLLIFINHRLVDCPPLKRAVENLYGTVLPKSSKPFLYIDLRLDPLVVDVNVHPTKREVQFLNQDEILFLIVDKVRDILTQTNQSRNYHVQSLLSPTKTAALDAGPIASGESSPRTPLPTGDKQRGNGADDGNKSNNDSVEIQLSLPNTPKRRNGAHMPVSIVTPPSSNTPRSARKIPEQIMVRTDSRSLPLQSFAFTSPTAKSRLSYQLLSDNDSDEDLALEFTKSTSSRPSSTSKGGANATLLTRQIPVTMVPLTETTQPQADPATASSPSILKRKYDESAATAVTTSTSPTRQPLQTTLFGTQAAQPGSKPPHVAPKNAPQPSSGSGSSQGQAETHQQGGGSPLVPPHADTPLTLASSLNIKKRPRVNVRLTSILELQQELKDTQHRELTQVLNGHHFVGFIDCTRVLVQHQTKLYVVDLQDISEELFYQLVIKDFHNFGYMVLDPPAPIYDLVLAALRVEEAENNLDERLRPVETVARAITDLIVSRQEMLDEYYCMKITSSGLLQTLPMLLRNYHPSMTKLPLFLLRIGCEVNWENEREFFEGFSRELAYLYACEPPESPPTPEGSSIQPEQESSSQDTGEADNAEMAEYKSMVQHTLLSALKTGFVATSRLTESRCVMQIADLPDLYKIFERC